MLRSVAKSDVCKPWCCCNSKGRISFKNVSAACIRFKSHYTTLGVDPKATPEEIKSAYYKLSLKFHPDKNDGSQQATAKFREISEAYEILGNPERKQRYDMENAPRNSGAAYQNPSQSFGQRTRRKDSNIYTGKTSYYDFDAHYREHYERYYEMKRMRKEYSFENFRRRQAAQRAATSFKGFLAVWVVAVLVMNYFSSFIKEPERNVIYYSSKPDHSADTKKDREKS